MEGQVLDIRSEAVVGHITLAMAEVISCNGGGDRRRNTIVKEGTLKIVAANNRV